MGIGPTQLLLVFGPDRSAFDEALAAELQRLQDEQIVRVLDALAVFKDADGEVEVRQLGDCGQDSSIAIDCGADVLEQIPEGSRAALILLEHHWTWRLHDVIASLSGFAISDGFIIGPVGWSCHDGRRGDSRMAGQTVSELRPP
jgi:hypothetical protein